MSMGTRREQIRKISCGRELLWRDGNVIGLVFGYAFSLIAGIYRIIPLDPQVYAVPYVPFHPSIVDGVWITVVAMGIR